MTKYAEPSFPGILANQQDELRGFDRDLMSVLSTWAQVLQAILDRGISVDDNLDVRRVSVASHATPGTEFSVAHTLGKIPVGYVVYGQTAAGSVYDGSTTNTKTTLYLKSDVGGVTFRLIVF